MIRFNCPNCGRLCEIAPMLAALPLLCKGCGQRLVVPAESERLPPPPPPAPKPKLPPAAPKAPPAPVPQIELDADETARFPRAAATPPKPAPPAPKPPIEEDDEDDDGPSFLMADIPVSPDIDFDLPGKTAAHESDAHRARMSNTGYSGTLTGSAQPTPQAIPQPPPRPARPKLAVVPPPADAEPEAASAPAPGGLSKVLPIVVDVCVGLLLLVVGAFLGEMLAGKSTREIWSDAGSSVKFPPIDLLMWLAPPVVFVMTYALLASRGRSLGGWLKRRQAA